MKPIIKLIILAILVAGCSSSKTPVAELYEAFEQKGHRMKLGTPYSGVILVAVDDSIQLHEAYGFEDWKLKTPHQLNGEFPIGSITKQFTAMLTMICVEKNLIDLHQSISAYLPSLENRKLRNATMHQLLNHSSGLPHYEGLVSLGYSYSKYATSSYTPEELVGMIDQCSMRFKPGEGTYYSSLGYMLVGAILEKVTGQTYAELLSTYITEPLEMSNTAFGTNDYVQKNVVKGFRYKELYGLDWIKSDYGGSIQLAGFRDQSGKYAAGGIHSTVSDLWKWSKAIRQQKLISASSYDLMFRPNQGGFGYGWIINWDDLVERNTLVQMIMHGGALPGYKSAIALYEDGTTIISLSNIQTTRDKDLLHQTYLAAHDLNDEHSLEGYPEWPSIKKFNDNGGFQALNQYFDRLSDLVGYPVKPSASSLLRIGVKMLDVDEEAKADSIFSHVLSTYEINSNSINEMGYRLLEMNQCERAKKFFSYNLHKDSLSANNWDSMGDAYKMCEEKELAKQSYMYAIDWAKAVGDKSLNIFEENLASLTD